MRRKSITMKGESWMSPWLLSPPKPFRSGALRRPPPRAGVTGQGEGTYLPRCGSGRTTGSFLRYPPPPLKLRPRWLKYLLHAVGLLLLTLGPRFWPAFRYPPPPVGVLTWS